MDILISLFFGIPLSKNIKIETLKILWIEICQILSHKPRDYKFEYGVSDPHTGDHKSQWEVRENGVVRGEYSLLEPDGTTRIVQYTADDHNGFRAIVKKVGHAIHPSSPTHHAPEIHKIPEHIPEISHTNLPEPYFKTYDGAAENYANLVDNSNIQHLLTSAVNVNHELSEISLPQKNLYHESSAPVHTLNHETIKAPSVIVNDHLSTLSHESVELPQTVLSDDSSILSHKSAELSPITLSDHGSVGIPAALGIQSIPTHSEYIYHESQQPSHIQSIPEIHQPVESKESVISYVPSVLTEPIKIEAPVHVPEIVTHSESFKGSYDQIQQPSYVQAIPEVHASTENNRPVLSYLLNLLSEAVKFEAPVHVPEPVHVSAPQYIKEPTHLNPEPVKESAVSYLSSLLKEPVKFEAPINVPESVHASAPQYINEPIHLKPEPVVPLKEEPVWLGIQIDHPHGESSSSFIGKTGNSEDDSAYTSSGKI